MLMASAHTSIGRAEIGAKEHAESAARDHRKVKRAGCVHTTDERPQSLPGYSESEVRDVVCEGWGGMCEGWGGVCKACEMCARRGKCGRLRGWEVGRWPEVRSVAEGRRAGGREVELWSVRARDEHGRVRRPHFQSRLSIALARFCGAATTLKCIPAGMISSAYLPTGGRRECVFDVGARARACARVRAHVTACVHAYAVSGREVVCSA